MAEKKSLVEEALIQMKNLENVVSENAKGILASTMKEEISDLVKESLKEAEEESEQEEMDMDMDITDVEDDKLSDDEETVDLRDFEDEDLMQIINSMSDDDKIIIAKDGEDSVDVEKLSSDSHSQISLGDSEMSDDEEIDMDMDSDEEEEEMDMSDEDDEDDEEEEDEEMTESWEENESEEMDEESEEESDEEMMFEVALEEDSEEETDEESKEEMDEESEEESDEEIMFEISLDDDDSEWSEISFDDDEEDEFNPNMDSDYEDEMVYESKIKKAIKKETKEGAMTVKPKGVGMGKPGKVYPKSLKHGTAEKEVKEKVEAKEGAMTVKPKGIGMGKPKFEYKEGKKMVMKPAKKGGETSEASRTLGAGRKFGRKGLPKPKAAPRHLEVESVDRELNILRERNEEYRKALNIFRNKLNEVAVFNSNLAYATRLFTEHSTTKQEKINILRRFDGVESLKESKTLYKTIKDELSSHGESKVVKESINRIEKTVSSGSSTNLIESKTYENPQFLRMKDLMSKIK